MKVGLKIKFSLRVHRYLREASVNLADACQGVVIRMSKKHSNAYIEARSELLRQAECAARGFRNTENFILISNKVQSHPESSVGNAPRTAPLPPAGVELAF